MRWKHYKTVDHPKWEPQVGRGLFGIRLLMYQSIPKPPIPPPGQSPGIWLALSSAKGEFDPKWSPPGGAFDFCQRSEAKGFRNFFDSAREPRSRVIALVDSTWIFLLLSFYIVISWNMPLFKVWSEDKLNKKFVVAENFAELVSQLL